VFDDSTLADVLAHTEEPAEREAIQSLIDDLHVGTVSAVLGTLRHSHRFHDVVDVLARTELATLIEAVLPGIPDDVDVRAVRSRRYVPDWQGDLFVRPSVEGGASVTIGSQRGARALVNMSRLQRAAITSYSFAARDGEDEIALHATLATTHFDGVDGLSVDENVPSSIAASMILHAPSLADYGGPLDVEIAEALATSTVRSIQARKTVKGALDRLAGAPWLRELWLSCLDHEYRANLPALLNYPALAELHASYADLDDDDLALLSRISTLEKLHLEKNKFGDRGGVSLARLSRLRELDLHETAVGDATAIALAELPNLTALDLAETQVTVVGIRALAKSASLKRLGLAWNLPDEATAATKELGCSVEWNDYISGGGALWGAGYMGP
jgi:hypothetical protein